MRPSEAVLRPVSSIIAEVSGLQLLLPMHLLCIRKAKRPRHTENFSVKRFEVKKKEKAFLGIQ